MKNELFSFDTENLEEVLHHNMNRWKQLFLSIYREKCTSEQCQF